MRNRLLPAFGRLRLDAIDYARVSASKWSSMAIPSSVRASWIRSMVRSPSNCGCRAYS